MENKGLCITCVYDAECTFNRTFPVICCEEFSDIEPKPKKKKSKNREEGKSSLIILPTFPSCTKSLRNYTVLDGNMAQIRHKNYAPFKPH